MTPVDITVQRTEDIRSQPHYCYQPHRQVLTNLITNGLRKSGQGPRLTNLRGWGLRKPVVWQCGQLQTMNHIIVDISINKFEACLQSFHKAEENECNWLETRALVNWMWRAPHAFKTQYSQMKCSTRDLRSFEIRFEFKSDDSNSIRKWRADSKFSNQPHLPSDHKPRSLFNKKLQPLRRCNWDLF